MTPTPKRHFHHFLREKSGNSSKFCHTLLASTLIFPPKKMGPILMIPKLSDRIPTKIHGASGPTSCAAGHPTSTLKKVNHFGDAKSTKNQQLMGCRVFLKNIQYVFWSMYVFMIILPKVLSDRPKNPLNVFYKPSNLQKTSKSWHQDESNPLI